MVEAVNSVIANASLSRGSVPGAVSNARPDIQPSGEAVRAPFISPRITINPQVDRAVLQIRDSETGDVLTQFPSESRIRAIQAQQSLEAAQSARQAELTGVSERSSAPTPAPVPVPTQSFDAGAIATLQAPQGTSTSDIQLATIAFSSQQANSSAPPAPVSVNVTA